MRFLKSFIKLKSSLDVLFCFEDLSWKTPKPEGMEYYMGNNLKSPENPLSTNQRTQFPSNETHFSLKVNKSKISLGSSWSLSVFQRSQFENTVPFQPLGFYSQIFPLRPWKNSFPLSVSEFFKKKERVM